MVPLCRRVEYTIQLLGELLDEMQSASQSRSIRRTSKIESMTHIEAVSRHSQIDFTHAKTTITFKSHLTPRNILNVISMVVECLANCNPV